MNQPTTPKSEWKAQKKAYRKAKRKYVQPWKLLAILLIVPALLVQAVGMVVNTSNALQMDFLTDDPYGIDAMLWTGGVGQSGLNAVCDILAGKVDPSGSLVAIYCYDNYSSPAMVNFAPMEWGGFADSGLKLYDMMGLDYDDPKWEQLLDQLTFEEMAELIGDAFHWTMPVESINAPGTRNENGPQGLTARLFPIGPKFATVALTSEDVMAATFNRELAYANGKVVGNDCVDNNVAVLYGPGNNIHRTPYSGRNFEYYSEDGFLSGQITRQEVQGVQDMGAQVTMKHFALNDHENARVGISIWANEQSIREVYLKAFQPAFEAESASGVMTSYTRWGTTWAGAHEGLITGILRGEWGCQGMVLSDNCRNHMDAISGVAAGSSAYDDMMGGKEGDLLAYKDDPTAAALMREACHHNLYTIVNSLGMNGVGPDTTVKAKDPGFATTVRVLRVLLPVLFLACLGLYIWGRVRFSKTEACQTYQAQKKARKDQ